MSKRANIILHEPVKLNFTTQHKNTAQILDNSIKIFDSQGRLLFTGLVK